MADTRDCVTGSGRGVSALFQWVQWRSPAMFNMHHSIVRMEAALAADDHSFEWMDRGGGTKKKKEREERTERLRLGSIASTSNPFPRFGARRTLGFVLSIPQYPAGIRRRCSHSSSKVDVGVTLTFRSPPPVHHEPQYSARRQQCCTTSSSSN